MALNLTDFTKLPLQRSALADVFGDILRGYQTQQAPGQMRKEQEGKDLANATLAAKLPYAEKQEEASIALKQAQARQAESGGAYQGTARNHFDMHRLMNDPNVPDDVKQQMKSEFEQQKRLRESIIENRQSVNENRSWNSLPADSKNNVLAEGAGFGLSERQTIDLYNKNMTVPEYAKSIGATDEEISNLQKNFAPTGRNRTEINQMKGNLAEAEYLYDAITDVSSQYSQRFVGFSPKEVWQAITAKEGSEARKQRAEFLGAQILAPELALLQIKLASGSNAEKAIHNIQERLLGNAKRIGITITPEDYEIMTSWVQEKLQEGAKRRISAMSGSAQNNQQNIGGNSNNDPLGWRK